MVAFVLIAGLVALVVGAELLVRGASRIAAQAGISPLVIGLTVVAFGTSAPELAVSVGGALTGQSDVALGNVLGSNTFNVLFVLGASAVIVPLVVSSQLVRLDVPVMIGVSGLVMMLAWDGRIGRVDGLVLLTGIVVYTGLLFRIARRTGEAEAPPTPEAGSSLFPFVVLAAVGLGLLVLGARWMVGGAVTVAEMMGVSELVIGLTVVAVGTSLPEVVTSLVAAFRGERDIAVGNVVGSNIFNLLGVLGATAAIAPEGVAVDAAVLRFDLPVMVAVAVVCLPIFFTGLEIARWEGALLLGYYAAYTCYVVLAATRHVAQGALADAMLWFVMPLTVVTLAVSVLRSRRGGG